MVRGLKSEVQIASPAAQVDAADDQLFVASGHQCVYFLNDLRQRQGTAVAADTGDHTERAAVIAPVLDFEVGPRRGVLMTVGGLKNRGGEEFSMGEDVGDVE